MIRYLITLPLVSIVSATPLLVNPDFEASPFTNGWTSSGVTEVVGLNGTNKAARLPYNTSASLAQTTISSVANFTFDVCFQIAGTNEAQSFRMALLADGNDAIKIRAGSGGALQVGTGDSTYVPLTTITDGAGTAIPASQTVKLRVIGRDFGTSDAQYDLLWTAPYTGASVPSFTHAALGLAVFASPLATSTAVDGILFQRNIVAGNSFTVDEVAMEGAAEVPGIAATHEVLLPTPPAPYKIVNISGVYPHLAMTNTHDECGVGAVVPWADKLWVITYGPHLPNGSTDKLYEITPQLARIIRPESVGGTPANRFIHAATNQLNIGPHFIDAVGKVRTLPPSVAPGRHTATAAHLTDPNRLYILTMEDAVYDVDARDLSFITRYPDVQGMGDRFLFGYHGKGAYTGQGRLVVANNGRPNNQETPIGPAGVLATWDGTTVEQNGGGYTDDHLANPASQGGNPRPPHPQYIAGWNHVTRTQHCEVTGPGGIHGNSNPETDPIWATGFDAKSVLLHVMENQQWNVWRLPKASYSHDGSHGWHTEWPRIRQLDPTDPQSIYLMHMHGLFFDFPKTFSAADFAGLKPISNYYKMPTDYCTFEGRIVMGKNDASKFANPLALKNQSNLWFGTMEDIKNWGAPSGHGAVWMNEAVAAAQVSDPFLTDGFPKRTLHLRNLGAVAVSVEIQTSDGTPTWTPVRSVNVPAMSYVHEIVSDLAEPWVRLKSSAASSNLTAFFHMASPYPHGTPASAHRDEFAALADIRDTRSISDGIIRVMNDPTLPLEFASWRADEDGKSSSHRYHRIGGNMELEDVTNTTAENGLRTTAALNKEFGFDSASAWIDHGGVRFRLPKLDPLYEEAFAAGWARGVRETVTERELLNCHGTFYEVPRSNSGGFRKMRALATHGKRITDFASWRGLFVLTGVLDDAPASDKLMRNPDGTAALWLGEIDDLWRMGEPRGTGGPWKDTAVTANTASDPYLMYGFDHKELTLSATEATTITVEVDFLADNTWSIYQTFGLAAGETLTHTLPADFHAHWVRVKSSAATTVTAQFTYGPTDSRDAFLDWGRDHGLPIGAGRTALAYADPDGDGVPNLAKFVFGLNPHANDASPLRVADGKVEFLFRDLQEIDCIKWSLEFSTTLADPWIPWGDAMILASDQTGVPASYQRIYKNLEPDHEKFFVRAWVSLEQ